MCTRQSPWPCGSTVCTARLARFSSTLSHSEAGSASTGCADARAWRTTMPRWRSARSRSAANVAACSGDATLAVSSGSTTGGRSSTRGLRLRYSRPDPYTAGAALRRRRRRFTSPSSAGKQGHTHAVRHKATTHGMGVEAWHIPAGVCVRGGRPRWLGGSTNSGLSLSGSTVGSSSTEAAVDAESSDSDSLARSAATLALVLASSPLSAAAARATACAWGCAASRSMWPCLIS